jgi:hypothetical protein
MTPKAAGVEPGKMPAITKPKKLHVYQARQQREDRESSTSVMASGKVVCGIFFPRDELLRMEQLPINSSAHLINNSRLQIYKHSTWDVLP